MFDNLYDDIGGKIKISAKCLFVIGAIASVIAGIALMISDLLLYGILVAVSGPVAAWVSSWIMYAIGEILEITCENEENTRKILKYLEENSDINADEVSAYLNRKYDAKQTVVPEKETKVVHRWRCDGCGKMRSQTPCEYCGNK